jgi:hypothetical protein
MPMAKVFLEGNSDEFGPQATMMKYKQKLTLAEALQAREDPLKEHYTA